jgi:hypothetical protein
LQFLIKKKFTFFSAVIFFQFLAIKALDPDWIRIGSGLDLDPDPYPDPYWPPSGSYGSGSVKNEYGSETLLHTTFKYCWRKATPEIVHSSNYSTLVFRTPIEFAEDHLLGAVNLPVLFNEERVEIGTLFNK